MLLALHHFTIFSMLRVSLSPPSTSFNFCLIQLFGLLRIGQIVWPICFFWSTRLHNPHIHEFGEWQFRFVVVWSGWVAVLLMGYSIQPTWSLLFVLVFALAAHPPLC